MAAHPVLTITVNPALDVAATVEYLVPDHKMEALEHRRDPGGGGLNVSRVLRRLGVESRAWLAVGGAIGDEVIALADREGIEVVAHRIDGATRESVSISDRKTGHQYRVVMPGPTMSDHAEVADAVIALAAEADIVVLSGSLPPGVPDSFYASICDGLATTTTVVDAKGATLARVVEGAVDVVKPSRRELASLAGWIPTELEEIEVAARQVLDRGGVGALAVSLGGDGAVLVERHGAVHWFRPPDVVVQSTVGAGDAMVGGIVTGLTMGDTLVEATRRGVAAGTATVLTPGTDLCHAPDVERIIPEVTVVSSRTGERPTR